MRWDAIEFDPIVTLGKKQPFVSTKDAVGNDRVLPHDAKTRAYGHFKRLLELVGAVGSKKMGPPAALAMA